NAPLSSSHRASGGAFPDARWPQLDLRQPGASLPEGSPHHRAGGDGAGSRRAWHPLERVCLFRCAPRGGHGMIFLGLIVAVALLCGDSPSCTGALAAVSFHLHLLLDLVGTGGLPIKYLWPLSDHGWSYSGHWVLTSWPNV